MLGTKSQKYCALVGVHIEYSDHFDKEEKVYRYPCNIIALNIWFKNKITTIRGKSNSSSTRDDFKEPYLFKSV